MTIKSKVIKFTTAASFAVAGIATLSAAKLNSLSFNGTAQASTLQAPAKSQYQGRWSAHRESGS